MGLGPGNEEFFSGINQGDWISPVFKVVVEVLSCVYCYGFIGEICSPWVRQMVVWLTWARSQKSTRSFNGLVSR